MSKQNKASLYLIPIPISENGSDTIPAQVIRVLTKIRYLLAENPKTARKFLKELVPQVKIEQFYIEKFDKKTSPEELLELMKPLKQGNNMGIISESGSPAIADPGAMAVSYAHRYGYRVIPLTGPSSILLALIASGLNGQNFAFHGYLPIDNSDFKNKIKLMEKEAHSIKQTQIFMETPYRNNKMLAKLLGFLQPDTKLCIAADISGQGEYIKTMPVEEWRINLPDLHKIPTIFLIGE